MSYIGLDLGGSYIKAAILDIDAKALRYPVRRPFPAFIPSLPPGFREVSVPDIIRHVRELLNILLEKAPEAKGILICNQMHGLILTDAYGQALSNFISWQDQRVLKYPPSDEHSYLDVLSNTLGPEKRRELGNELIPGLPISTLYWLQKNGQLPSNKVYAASLGDFIPANFCRTTPVTEATNAAAHGLFNVATGDWDIQTIVRIGLEGLCLPQLYSVGEIAGYFRYGQRNIPFHVAIGDQQCALLATNLGDRELSLNIATGSQASVISSTPSLGHYQTRPFFDQRWLKTITHIPAGRAVNALLRLLTELYHTTDADTPTLWRYIEENVKQVVRTDIQVNLAFFESSCGNIGNISGLREDNMTVGHLFRAVYENMAENFYRCANRIVSLDTLESLVLSGGLAQKLDNLRAVIETRFGCRYRLCQYEEDTLTGLLMIARWLSGITPSITHPLDRD